jgi:hypothetical protein
LVESANLPTSERSDSSLAHQTSDLVARLTKKHGLKLGDH